MTDYSHPTEHQTGFSLIELMVAMTLGLLLMIGLVSVVINTNQSYGELNKASLRLENGRYAMQVISEDIRHAGFYGEYYNLGSPPGALPDPCDTTLANLQLALPLSIQGYNAPASSPLSCLASANHLSGTDILVVRRAATTATPLADLKSSRIYVQTRNDTVVMDTGKDSNKDPATTAFTLTEKDGVTRADIRQYHVDIYFISPCSVPAGSACSASDDGGNPIPSLKRLELTANGMTTVPLVEGIEGLQIEYGIDRSGDGAPNESTSGAGDAYVTNPANITEWSNVAALRLFLLARNLHRSTGHSDTKSYNLGQAGTTGPFNDTYKRHVFSTAVRVVNPSSRRETP